MDLISRKRLFPAALMLLLTGCVIFAAIHGLSALALPFTALGKGLRLLSLSGTAGNTAAIALYVLLRAAAVRSLLYGEPRTAPCDPAKQRRRSDSGRHRVQHPFELGDHQASPSL